MDWDIGHDVIIYDYVCLDILISIFFINNNLLEKEWKGKGVGKMIYLSPTY